MSNEQCDEPEVTGNRVALPVVGETLTRTSSRYKTSDTPGLTLQSLRRTGVGKIHRTGHGVAQALPACAIGTNDRLNVS